MAERRSTSARLRLVSQIAVAVRAFESHLHRGRVESAAIMTAALVVAFGGLAVLPAAAIDVFTGGEHAGSLALSAVLMLVVGAPVVAICKLPMRMSTQGLFSSLVIGAIAMMCAGAVVHLMTGAIDNVPDALVEGAAGVSTTAASLIDDPAELSRGEQFFRAMLQWGSGVVSLVVIVKVFPRLGIGGLEAGGGVATRAASRLSPTTGGNVRRLMAVYAIFTAVVAVLYLLAGMRVFDAVLHAMSLASTGGWSTRAGSIGAFSSGAIEWVSVAGMFFAGVSLPFAYRVFRTGDVRLLWSAFEFRAYAALVVISWWVLVFWSGDWSVDGIRAGAFASTSAISTTGLLTVDPSHFDGQGATLLITLVAIGGMAASLTGGIRIARVLVVFGVMGRELTHQIHESSIKSVRVGRSTVGDQVVSRILGEVSLNALVAAVGYMALALFGDDVFEAIGSAVSLLATAGPAYGSDDPTSTLTALDAGGHYVGAVLMMLGRISVLPVLGLIAVGTKPIRRQIRAGSHMLRERDR